MRRAKPGITLDGALVWMLRLTMFEGGVVAVAGSIGGLPDTAVPVKMQIVSNGRFEQPNVTTPGNCAPGVVGVTVSVLIAAPPGGTEPDIEVAMKLKSEFTVKIIFPDVPPVLVTETFWAPTAAFGAITRVAVTPVLPTTDVLITITPAPLKLTVAGTVKPEPEIVMFTLLP